MVPPAADVGLPEGVPLLPHAAATMARAATTAASRTAFLMPHPSLRRDKPQCSHQVSAQSSHQGIRARVLRKVAPRALGTLRFLALNTVFTGATPVGHVTFTLPCE